MNSKKRKDLQNEKLEAVEDFSNELTEGTTSNAILETYEMLSQEDTEKKNKEN